MGLPVTSEFLSHTRSFRHSQFVTLEFNNTGSPGLAQVKQQTQVYLLGLANGLKANPLCHNKYWNKIVHPGLLLQINMSSMAG